MSESGFITRLRALRRTVRRRLALFGLFTVLAFGVAAFLMILAFDWLLSLPVWPRIFVATVYVIVLAGAIRYWLIKPFRARIGLDDIARRIEHHFDHLRDRLVSTVSFLEDREGGSPRMIERVISNTERVVSRLPMESVLSLKPLGRRFALLVLSAVAVVGVFAVWPEWVRTGMDRYIYPFGGTEWPRAVSIVPLTGDVCVAVGESATVRMKIERGLHEGLRGVVHFREPSGNTIKLSMRRDDRGVFDATIDAVTEDLIYWFEAGDDGTERKPLAIRAVHRPAVAEALAAVEPPSYAAVQTSRTYDLADGPVEAPLGGYVTVAVRSTKPIPMGDEAVGAALRGEEDRLIPLLVDPADNRLAAARFEVTDDLYFRIELRDAEGFENRGAVRHSILAVADGPPSVTVLEPMAVTELTPTGSVRVVVRTVDDFGVTHLGLRVERLGTSDTYDVPLTDRLVAAGGTAGFEAVAEYLWSVKELALSPGDILIYRAMATDNCIRQDVAGQVGVSSSMRIKIISQAEFDGRLRDELALLEARIRAAALDQGDMADGTAALVQDREAPTLLDEAGRESAGSLAAGQARLVRRLHDLVGRFSDLIRRMERNHAGDQEARRRIASVGDTLVDVAAGPMTTASALLGEAREQEDVTHQQDALRRAVEQERTATDRLQALVHVMAQWSSFRGLVAKTRDLLDRQASLRTDTASVGARMLGRPVTSLTPEQISDLRRVKRRQDQLANDVEHLLERMDGVSAAVREKDPSGAEAMDAALRAARAHEVTGHVRAAAEAIESNRTAAAVIEQKGAEQALRKILDALNEREDRELLQLRKHLQRADELVARMIEEQEALRGATHEAALMGVDDEAFASLEQQQRQLRRNAKFLGEDLARVRRTTEPGRLIQQCVEPMGEAERQLQDQQAREAVAGQDEALELLRDARARLEEIAREAQERAWQRSLAQIQDDLERVRDNQSAINQRIEKLAEAVEARGRVSRPEAREASKLSREQGRVRRMTDEVMPDLEQVVVYQWALERVAGWMDASRDRLIDRKIDDELSALTGRIVHELDKLIQAIVETKEMPLTTEFAEDEGGGGGSGDGAQAKPVPTVTELLVLKAMQTDINERTLRLHQAFDPQAATELQLRKLREIAEDQSEVRRLAEMVTGRMHQP